MSNQNIQILELAKQGLTAAEIAEALGYDIADVEYVLKFDPEMEKALGKAGIDVDDITTSKQLTDREIEVLRPIALLSLRSLIQGAEKESVQWAATQYVLDHQLGLKEPKKEQTVNNIVILNERLLASRERYKQLKEKNQIVDVESAQVTTAA